ncbi:EamA family transporter [Paraburkholderia madseniana]|uniref:EamA family transporter n=2 Tax=Paraburkholderia madseniana TaxID=2599607 RepID=A0A6N6W3G1_9BURK|nr:EamA family transporter [Paraburkholderia madseniana]
MLLVGCNVGIGKTLVEFLPVPIFATLRFVIAVVVLGPLIRLSKLRRVALADWGNLFLQALFGTFLFTLLMLNGVQRTDALDAGVITSVIPAVVAIFAWILLGERPAPRTILSILLATAGVLLVNVSHANDAGGTTHQSLAGNLFVFGAVCCEALYVIFSRRVTATIAPIDVCVYTHSIGLLLILPIGGSAVFNFHYADVPSDMWLLVMWYALSASVFSFWLWMQGIKRISGSVAGVFTAMVPVAAAIYGVVVGGERFTLTSAIAMVLVISGVVVASSSKTAQKL